MLSLYLDKANWFERIAQGKSIGFVIILVGLLGLAFSVFKILKLREYSAEVIADSENSIPSHMEKLITPGAPGVINFSI